jgi:hypothetical protein
VNSKCKAELCRSDAETAHAGQQLLCGEVDVHARLGEQRAFEAADGVWSALLHIVSLRDAAKQRKLARQQLHAFGVASSCNTILPTPGRCGCIQQQKQQQ